MFKRMVFTPYEQKKQKKRQKRKNFAYCETKRVVKTALAELEGLYKSFVLPKKTTRKFGKAELMVSGVWGRSPQDRYYLIYLSGLTPSTL
jgi:hypothetical protein